MKPRQIIASMVTLLLVPLLGTTLVFATDLDISDLTFNPETREFSGKTSPNTNIQFEHLATQIVADNEGHFSFQPVPEEFAVEKIQFNDFINDASKEIEYDFVKGEEVRSDASETTADSSEASSTKTTSQAPPSSTTPKKQSTDSQPTEQKKVPLVIWLALMILLLLFALTLFLFIAKQKKARQVPPPKKRRRKRKHPH